jgi:hypothetical protein
MGRTVAEIREAMRQPVRGHTVIVKETSAKPGHGVYLAPYDGPMGTDDRAPVSSSKETIKLGAKVAPNGK